MLTAASKRALPRDALKQTLPGFEAIQLRFLYPAFFIAQPISRKAPTSKSSRPRLAVRSARSRLSHPPRTANSPQHRNLASAAAAIAHDYEPHQDDFIPFEGAPADRGSKEQSQQESPSFFSLPGFAPDISPLILQDAPTTTMARFKSFGTMPGDLNEIHSTLQACLQVGRLDRAATLVRRLNQIYKPNAPGLIAAHNDYIRETTLRILRTKDQGLLKELQRWFEEDLQQQQVAPTPATYALMIQACMYGSVESQASGSIERYASMAKTAGVGDETMDLVSSLETSAEALRYFEEPKPHSKTTDTKVALAFNERVPEIRPVDQKGLGLSTLKKSLLTLNEPEAKQDTRSDYLKLIEGDQKKPSPEERQQTLERNTLQAALDRWQEEDAHLKSMGVVNVLSTSSLGAIMWKWHERLVASIRDELQKAVAAENQPNPNKADTARIHWAPYLQTVTPEKLSALTILTCTKVVTLDSADERGMKVLTVVKAIGSAIQEEALFENLKSNQSYRQWRALSRKSYWKNGEKISKQTSLPSPISGYANKSNREQELERLEWPTSIKIKIGAMMLSLLLDVARVEICRPDPKTGREMREEQPVFFHTFSYQGGKRVGVVRFNPTMRGKLLKAPMSPSLAKHLPMLAVPKPWVGFREGGFLEQAIGVIRLDSVDLQARRYAISASENGDMSKVFAGLDVLAKTPWKINRGVFDVMVEAWNSGKAIAKIPPEHPTMDVPPEPPQSAPLADRLKWIRQTKEAENHKGGLRAQRCFQNFQLEVARAFLDETFYFPHNVDFRGRAYPMAPFLNHMGADNARGLLTFAERRILGPNGLRWLKIHLANMFGYDKASLQERVEFTEKHMLDITDSAHNGLYGGRWWLTAEDPWQCLAACKELVAALKLDDPTTFRSSLAIHQDGTCNGLQHYAALGGDAAGAKQVNLEPGDRPSDIYSAVAEVIRAEVKEDAAKGHAIAVHLDGVITRKVVKQTVMTNVYGVTFLGARNQVRKQLDAILTTFPDTQTVNRNTAAGYIARRIFTSLAKMFNGAHDIQHWLGDCAGRICSSLSPYQIEAIKKEQQNETRPSVFNKRIKPLRGGPKIDPAAFTTGVIWTTPLKMPVVQSYSRKSQSQVNTNFQLISIQNPSIMDPVHKAKQLQAFPPNFIHSLDGTHMFLTALKCHHVGLTFAAVHDSFWSHAGDIDTLNRITRDAFIMMHSENIIERLRAEFETRYAGHMELASVPARTEVGRKIRAWRRAQGHADISSYKTKERTTELLLEARRIDLLSSTNPEERIEGEKMVTPGSIYKESSTDEDFLTLTPKMLAASGQVSTRQVKLKANQRLEVGDMHNADSVVLDDAQIPAITEADEVKAKIGSAISARDSDLFNAIPTGDFDASWIRRAEERRREMTKENQRKYMKTLLWLPLKFPPVPKKGDFDVNRLRDSQYFFS